MALGESEHSGAFFSVKPGDKQLLKSLQVKYSSEYMPYITMISKSQLTEAVPEQERILVSGQEIIKNIGTILEVGLSFETGRKLLLKTFDMMKEFDEDLKKVRRAVERDEIISREVKKVDESTGKNFGDLVNAHQGISNLAEKTIEPSSFNPLSALREASPEGYEMGKKVGGAGLQSLLGPFSGLASTAWNIGASTVGGVGSLIKKSRQSSLGEALMRGGGAGNAEFSPPSLGPSAAGSQRLSGSDLENASAPMYDFWDKGAYKASWTSELLKKLGGEGEGKKEGGFGELAEGVIGGFVGKALAPIVGTLATLGTTIGPVLAAFSAPILAFFGSKSIDKLYEMGSALAKPLDLIQKVIPGADLVDQIRHIAHPLDYMKRKSELYSSPWSKPTEAVNAATGSQISGITSSHSLSEDHRTLLEKQNESLSQIKSLLADQGRKTSMPSMPQTNDVAHGSPDSAVGWMNSNKSK